MAKRDKPKERLSPSIGTENTIPSSGGGSAIPYADATDEEIINSILTEQAYYQVDTGELSQLEKYASYPDAMKPHIFHKYKVSTFMQKLKASYTLLQTIYSIFVRIGTGNIANFTALQQAMSTMVPPYYLMAVDNTYWASGKQLWSLYNSSLTDEENHLNMINTYKNAFSDLKNLRDYPDGEYTTIN